MSKAYFPLITFSALMMAVVSVSARAAGCDAIPRWMKLRELTFRVTEPTRVYDVKVELPEVASLPCSASYLEYGTDYYFSLASTTPVKLSYFEKGETQVRRTSEMSRSLNAHSVMLAAERTKTPHFFEVIDEELAVEYHIFLSKDHGPAYVTRSGSQQKFKVISFR